MALKSLFLPATIFLMGYVLGKHGDSELHIFIEDWVSKTKEARNELATLLLDVMERVESISSDEVKANFEKASEIIKDKLEELKG